MIEIDVVTAAREMRAGVSSDPRAVPGWAPVVDDLIERAAAGEAVGDKIVVALAADPAARDELRRRLSTQDQDTDRGVGSGYAGLPGLAEPSDELVYRCAGCDYAYPIFEAGEPVPTCPRGHGALQLLT